MITVYYIACRHVSLSLEAKQQHPVGEQVSVSAVECKDECCAIILMEPVI